MGTASAFNFSRVDSNEILKKIEESENETDKQNYEVWVNSVFNSLLAQFNNRDSKLITEYIHEIKEALNTEIEGTITTKFGGSISKHTHIEGLSDIDTLVILNNSELIEKSPQQVLDFFYEELKEKVNPLNIKKGNKTVTLIFKDIEIELIPAIRYKTGVKIPDGEKWSKIVQPTVFARRLTILNQKLNGKLIPAIKLIKGIIAGFPTNCQLNGYHIENIALQVFQKKISNANTINDLVLDFFKDSSKYVNRRIKDVSGQTQYLDDYLGKKDSIQRLMVADTLERTFRQMELANAAGLKSTWNDLLSHF